VARLFADQLFKYLRERVRKEADLGGQLEETNGKKDIEHLAISHPHESPLGVTRGITIQIGHRDC
jgi:hypothetical protein